MIHSGWQSVRSHHTCKIGLKNTLFISGRKMVICCFVVLLFCLLQLCPILAYFFFLKTLLKGKNFAVE